MLIYNNISIKNKTPYIIKEMAEKNETWESYWTYKI